MSPGSSNALKLFDTFRRTDLSPCGHAEDRFSFMNRCRRPEWASVRLLLEAWFENYPRGHALELRERLRSREEHQHLSAWWELYLFSLFSALGYEVVVHPDLEHTSKRPDFLVSAGRSRTYVEARLVNSGLIDDDPASQGPLANQMLDLINSGRHSSFQVGVNFHRVGTLMPKANEVLRPLVAWLDSMNPDAEDRRLRHGGNVESLAISPRDWVIEFDAFPVDTPYRGDGSQLIAIYPLSVGEVNDTERIREALRRKGPRYKDLGAPYVVALLTMSSFVDDASVEKALFGDIAWAYRINDPTYDQHWVRQRNGYWLRRSGVGGQKVSGVLVGKSLSPWLAASALPEMWLNPWAEHPLVAQLGLRTCRTTESIRFAYSAPTIDAATIFDLEPGWPEI